MTLLRFVHARGRPYLKDLPVLAESGYEEAGAGVYVPVRKPARGELDIDVRTRNSLLRSLGYQGERGFTLMSKRWPVLQRVMVSPTTMATSPNPHSSSRNSSTSRQEQMVNERAGLAHIAAFEDPVAASGVLAAGPHPCMREGFMSESKLNSPACDLRLCRPSSN
jgi:hypothetical protein